jgi:hypothetical protein
MRDHASSNAKGNFCTKSTVVKASIVKASQKMVAVLPPVNDLQPSLSLPNRPRLVSLEFHSSPRPLPRMTLLPRNLSEQHKVTPESIIRPKVLDARTFRALGLAPSSLSLSLPFHADAEPPLLPRAAAPRESNKDDEICVTPPHADIWMSGPPGLERDESRMLHSAPTAMPRELLVPDDF